MIENNLNAIINLNEVLGIVVIETIKYFDIQTTEEQINELSNKIVSNKKLHEALLKMISINNN